MHNVPVPVNNHIPYQALPGRQPHLLPPLEGGHHGDLDVKSHGNLARVREIAAIATIEATIEQRLARSDKRNQIATIETKQAI